MHQICPKCKKTIPDEHNECPHCGTKLNKTIPCPFCKKQINSQDTVCPHCNELLIYEYPKQITAKRNKVLIPLGISLLLSAIIYGYINMKGIQMSGMIIGLFMAVWLLGFALYGAYMGKGDTDFWWGK